VTVAIARRSPPNLDAGGGAAMGKPIVIMEKEGPSGRRWVGLIVLAGLLVWCFESPTDAAAAVRATWVWFTEAVEAIVTFVRTL
jgi:hypothetical protein